MDAVKVKSDLLLEGGKESGASKFQAPKSTYIAKIFTNPKINSRWSSNKKPQKARLGRLEKLKIHTFFERDVP